MTEGKLVKSARHLHYELPVRLAQRIVDFQAQPYAVISNPHFKQVYHKYHDAFDRFRTFPNISNMEDQKAFTRLVSCMYTWKILMIGNEKSSLENDGFGATRLSRLSLSTSR